MEDLVTAQVNGMLFGQTIAEHILGVGGLTREQLNAKYREIYQQIADGSLTLTNTFAEMTQQMAKEMPDKKVPQHVLDQLAAARNLLQQAQRNIATRILKIVQEAEKSGPKSE